MTLLAIAALAAPQVTVDITLPASAQQAGLNEAELEASLQSAIAEQLHTVNISGYMDQMANANLLSSKGMGVDYASSMQRFALGGSFGTAVNGAGFALTSGEGLPESGFALQIGVMGGLNLGAFSGPDSALRRFKLYVHGMSATTSRDPFGATFLNYGGHVQIQLAKGGKKTSGVRWGGLDLTSGYAYSSYILELNKALPISADDSLTWNATGNMTLTAKGASVPLELSTNLHIFVVSAFLGVAGDYNLSGDALASVGISGPVTINYDGDVENIGSASATISESGKAGVFVPRAFIGVQGDIFMVKVYGQLNVTSEGSVGAHAGLRVVL